MQGLHIVCVLLSLGKSITLMQTVKQEQNCLGTGRGIGELCADILLYTKPPTVN